MTYTKETAVGVCFKAGAETYEVTKISGDSDTMFIKNLDNELNKPFHYNDLKYLNDMLGRSWHVVLAAARVVEMVPKENYLFPDIKTLK